MRRTLDGLRYGRIKGCGPAALRGEYMSNLLAQVAEPQFDDTPYTYIYALVDPRNNLIRYIGKADSPKARYSGHLLPSQLKQKNHKTNWINGLLEMGLKPRLETLDWVPAEEWQAHEMKWIDRFRTIPGYPKLTNSTDGGEGVSGYVMPEEDRKKRAEARRGVPMPPGTGAKISAANKGKKKTKKHRDNLSIGQKKRWENSSDEDKKKMQNFPLPKMTDEIRKKIVEGLRNIPRLEGCSSKYRGVTKISRKNPWRAAVSVNNKAKHIGLFTTEEEAARARDRFILENFPGWNIELNFPRSDYQ